jgi:hypothetical protein
MLFSNYCLILPPILPLLHLEKKIFSNLTSFTQISTDNVPPPQKSQVFSNPNPDLRNRTAFPVYHICEIVTTVAIRQSGCEGETRACTLECPSKGIISSISFGTQAWQSQQDSSFRSE